MAQYASTVLLPAILLAGCSGPEPQRPGTPGSVQVDSAPLTPVIPPQKDAIIATRSVIFMHAVRADFDSLRARYTEEDAATIADDALWYRASAHEYLEQLKLPVRSVHGKRSFTFRVNGAPRTFDFTKVELLDAIVLYEPDREPRVIAPIDVQTASDYFALTTRVD